MSHCFKNLHFLQLRFQVTVPSSPKWDSWDLPAHMVCIDHVGAAV